MSDRPKPPSSSKPLSVLCPECNASFKLRNRDLIGRRMPCPECGHRFTVHPEPEIIEELEPEWIEAEPAPRAIPRKPDADLADLDNFDDMEELPAPEPAPERKSSRPRRDRSADDRDIFEVEPYHEEADDEPHSRAAPSPRDRTPRESSRRPSRREPPRSSSKRARSSSSSARMWGAIVGGLLLTLAVIIGAIFLIQGSSSASAAAQGRLAYLPADCQAVGVFRVGDLSRSPFFQTQLAGGPQLRGVVDQFRDRTGMDLGDLESVVIGIYRDEPAEFNGMSVLLNVPRNTPFVMVARANKDWDRTKLIGENTESATHNGETFHLFSPDNGSQGRWGLYLPDARTLVVGTQAEVQAAIDTAGEAPDWTDMEFMQPEYHVVTARVSRPGEEITGPSSSGPDMPIGMHAKTAGTGLQLDGDGVKHVTFLRFESAGEASQYGKAFEAANRMPGPGGNPGSSDFRQFGRTVAVTQRGLGNLGGMVAGSTAFAPLPFLACLGRSATQTPAPNPTVPVSPLPNPNANPPVVFRPRPRPFPRPNPAAPIPVAPGQNPPVPPQLEAPPDARTLDSLLADLREGKGFKAKAAAQQLAKMQPDPNRQKEAARLLENLITNGGHFDKQAAADALAVWGDADTVTFLLSQLDDPVNKDIFLKKRVLVALGKLKDPKAIVPIIAQLNNFSVRREAVEGLKSFGSAAEPELLKALAAAKDWQTQQVICDVLKDIGTARSLPQLDALAQSGHVFVKGRAQTAAVAIRGSGK